jgi:hypothetical protein
MLNIFFSKANFSIIKKAGFRWDKERAREINEKYGNISDLMEDIYQPFHGYEIIFQSNL